MYPGSIPESVVLADLLTGLGIPEEDIILEQKSRTTRENAIQTREILARLGFYTPVLITSASHMKRAVLAFHQAGLEVIPAPTDYITGKKAVRFSSFLPGPGAFLQVRRALWEYIGILFYRICAIMPISA